MPREVKGLHDDASNKENNVLGCRPYQQFTMPYDTASSQLDTAINHHHGRQTTSAPQTAMAP